MNVSWCCAQCVAVCEMREVVSVKEGHEVERVTETMRVTTGAMMKFARKKDGPASDVVGYGMVTRCHQHCGGATVHRQSCGHSSCAWKLVISIYPERLVCS